MILKIETFSTYYKCYNGNQVICAEDLFIRPSQFNEQQPKLERQSLGKNQQPVLIAADDLDQAPLNACNQLKQDTNSKIEMINSITKELKIVISSKQSIIFSDIVLRKPYI